MMKRRDFIRSAAAFSALSTTAGITGMNHALASTLNPSAYDLVAVKGNNPVAMFDKAMVSLGGMKAFVKPNQTVVVKPNIGWDASPERAANTNPLLVGRIVEQCFAAGAKKVFVFDHTCNDWDKCYTNSGIEKAVKDAGGTMVNGNSENYYQQVNVPKGKKLKDAKVHELILESDVFINVPILKSHGGATLTASMKNLMGIVWDRRYWHQNDLHQCIADFASFRKPDLNIVDAYRVMMKNGPRGVSVDDVAHIDALLVSKDMVAVDAAATKMFGKDPSEVAHIGLAHELGVGTQDLSSLNINRLKI